jgi:arsenate reductase-like glutaredoxin family protein
MKTAALNQIANDVYRLASGSSKTPENFLTWFIENEKQFELTEEDFTERGITRKSLVRICDLAEAAGFTF